MLKITDIVALAKAGYSVSDVKELLSMTSSEETEPTVQDNKKQDEKTEQPKGGKDTATTEPQKSTADPEEQTAINEYKEQIEKLNQKIEELQQQNVRRDNSGKEPEKSPTEIIDDITRSFM